MKHSHIWAVTAIIGLSFTLTGCLPTSRSVGVSLMAMPLDHRANGNDTDSHFSVSADGFWGHTFGSDNLQDLNIGGGNLSATYRLGGDFSPIFFNAAFGGFAGKTQFDCNADEDCYNKNYSVSLKKWLQTSEGQKHYTVWDLQERVLAGVDFNPGRFLIIGFGIGAQLYQGYSDYDDMRKNLGDHYYIENIDEKASGAALNSFWIGTHIGPSGEYGNFVSEYNLYFSGNLEQWIRNVKFTYTHPSGFFVGFSGGYIVENTLFAGKTFIF